MKILVADDHDVSREGLCRLIKAQPDMSVVGYAVNCNDVLAKTDTMTPDIVIIDPSITGMNCRIPIIALIHQISPDIKIVIFSLDTHDEYVHQSLLSGAVGYVPKLSSGRDVIECFKTVKQGKMYISPLIAKRVLDSYHNHVTDHECRYNSLTHLEQQIFRLWVEDHPLHEIAKQTACTEAVVIDTQKRISEKIQIHDSTTMIRYAEYIGIISPASRVIPILHS